MINLAELDLSRLTFSNKTVNFGATTKAIYNKGRVHIKEIYKLGKDGYKINADVMGTYRMYNVNMLTSGNKIYQWSCECQDYKMGSICKHLSATLLELKNPHLEEGNKYLEEKRKENIRRQEEERKKKLEKRQKEYEERQERIRKQQEYEEKYNDALGILKMYKRIYGHQEIDPFESFLYGYDDIQEDNTLDIKKVYEEALLDNNDYDNDLDLANSIKIENRVEIIQGSKLDITVKIGQTTKYVIKNFSEFYEAFESEKILKLGAKLTFIAKKENFVKEDQKLLDYILEYSGIIKYSTDLISNGYYRDSNPNKKMVLMENRIDRYFEVMKNKYIKFKNYMVEGDFLVLDESLKIEVSVKKERKESILQLNISDYVYVISENNIYIFYNGRVYKNEYSQDLEVLLNVFKYKDKVMIPEDKFQEYSSIVLPKMSKFMLETEIPEEITKEGLVVNKLSSKIFLDLDDNDNIVMDLKFCYLDKEFNILDNNYEKYIEENNIVRNVPDEKNVLKRIFQDGFELKRGNKKFVLKNQDKVYDFLSFKVLQYMNDFEVLATEKFKGKKIRPPKISNIPIKIDVGLLKIDISKIDINIDEISQLLKNYNLKKKYYKLKNGDFISLENNEDIEFLNDISNTFDVNYDNVQNGEIKLPINRSVYLEKLLNKNTELNTTKNDDYTKLINNIENKNFSDEIKIGEKFENILRDYQKTGYQWLKVLEHYQFGGILADDMGLGKTLQIISILNDELSKENKKTSIVISPSSLVLNWSSEIKKWCPEIKILVIKGDAATRKELISTYNEYDLLITSYDLLKRDVFEYENKFFKYIIADEAQYIKNQVTQNATALKSLEGEIRFALTGTPIENSIAELWSIFDFIMPGYLYTYSKFKKKFEEPILKLEDENAMKRLKMMINPFILRRIKKDVLKELPEKNITVMKNEMTPEQNKIYLAYLAQTQKEVAQEIQKNGFEKNKFKILMLLTRLRQICCHPSLFLEDYNKDSGKLIQCMDIINDAIDANHKILLFSSYTSMFDIIEQKLKKQGIQYYKLTGQTKIDKRVDMVEEFNNNDNIKIFLISLKAGGTGLNLTGADVVIHYDPWWNLSAENQATDRAYRIGQKNSVQVYKLITENSIEEKINKLQEKKAEISEQLLSTEETFINKLSKEEIMELFEM